MKFILEITAEDLKTFGGKTLTEILSGSGKETTGKGVGRPPKTKTMDSDDDFDLGEPDTEPDEMNFDDEDDKKPAIDLKILRAEVKKRMDKGKEEGLTKLFKKYKAKNLQFVKEDQYEDFYTDLMKIKL